MSIDLGQLIVWVITGALAGFLAGRLFAGKSFGVLGNVLIGLVGALLASALFEILNINVEGLPEFRFSLADLLTSFVGAALLLLLLRLVQRRSS